MMNAAFLSANSSRNALAPEQETRNRLVSVPSLVHPDRDLNDEKRFGDGVSFVRSGRQMRLLEAQANSVSRSDIPVLILGESGTGKEVLAKYIHHMSHRSNQTFLKVNCAAMPAELLESELYGHERGAFTGAIKTTPGKFEMSDGGTIFLDEIGEMSPTLQAKLLHVLQDGIYFRLGGCTPLKSNVRVIAATNIDVKAEIARKAFRQDLYYRLSGFSMSIPPLRERRDEIPLFVRHFMKKAALKHRREPLAVSDALMDVFNRYDWPGNLRELENVINRYVVMGDAYSIQAELGLHALSPNIAAVSPRMNGGIGLREHLDNLNQGVESATIAKVLEETRWNRRAAAKRMQISYTSLLYKIKRYNLAPDEKAKSTSSKRPTGRAQPSSGPSITLVSG
jgi:two-component system response regulator AtoC